MSPTPTQPNPTQPNPTRPNPTRPNPPAHPPHPPTGSLMPRLVAVRSRVDACRTLRCLARYATASSL